MKLRNKRTGRVVNFRYIAFDEPKDDRENYRYSSLAEFNEEWEDCTPKEPLIKDEKVRKAVRAWAEVWNSDQVKLDSNQYSLLTTVLELHGHCTMEIPNLNRNGIHTIAELCGEEE